MNAAPDQRNLKMCKMPFLFSFAVLDLCTPPIIFHIADQIARLRVPDQEVRRHKKGLGCPGSIVLDGGSDLDFLDADSSLEFIVAIFKGNLLPFPYRLHECPNRRQRIPLGFTAHLHTIKLFAQDIKMPLPQVIGLIEKLLHNTLGIVDRQRSIAIERLSYDGKFSGIKKHTVGIVSISHIFAGSYVIKPSSIHIRNMATNGRRRKRRHRNTRKQFLPSPFKILLQFDHFFRVFVTTMF